MALSRKLLFAAIAIVPVVIACNGIIGLNDFEYGECPGARCGDAGFDVSIDVRNDNDVPVEGGKEAGPGAGPVSWAQWPMPNNPDSGVGVPPSYTANGTGAGATISDDVTGLVWQASTLASDFTYGDALTACKQVAPVGQWRLPKRIELVTLIDYSRGSNNPAISPLFGLSQDKVWTSSEFRPFDTANPSYWIVDFESGVVRTQIPSANIKFKVLCVRGQ